VVKHALLVVKLASWVVMFALLPAFTFIQKVLTFFSQFYQILPPLFELPSHHASSVQEPWVLGLAL
jgi:hypothetical protein